MKVIYEDKQMELLNFNVCKKQLLNKTKDQTIRQDNEPRFKKGSLIRLIYKGKEVIGIGKITEIFSIYIQRKDMGIDYINDNYAFLYPKIQKIVKRDGFENITDLFNILHKIYDIKDKKKFYIYRWRWIR